ncbi:hypothetical protein P8A21_37460 [Streptomyces poriferorum]|uniref:Uncharacterized protein n=1 Tax=Streptomyces poriferorum TaxID=2798799 RepID=A0ABY9IH23_9ACTN|nr:MULTISPECIES: hypothetical protein [Streptomyces]MBW5249755.1 hypothetical protein [Streptomyces poriferorum]MBW5259618.1 hypothetical protein [Streptomyces poriferorum]MDP5316064.1 hypothetical protein [Streptomyces sp. Alt4]WLQ52833.1 hypothetical protein P8A21_37460 [Streptomyces sp. Alt1]WLQ54405.1 hypothetical protein P8A19_02630 [Streptomyces sp. Alt2]
MIPWTSDRTRSAAGCRRVAGFALPTATSGRRVRERNLAAVVRDALDRIDAAARLRRLTSWLRSRTDELDTGHDRAHLPQDPAQE